MTERRKDLLMLAALLGLLVIFFSKILFTQMIIRAPDIINEFYWLVIDTHNSNLGKIFDLSQIRATWNMEINSGTTTMGGNSSFHFLFWLKLIFLLIPPPASVAWCIVLHLFFGGAGLYLYCRTIGLSRNASFLAGLIFALAPENASLINAGHVMKIATISYAPWAFFCLERGFKSRRVFWFLCTGFVLAIQFFQTHWQIAYYTCLGVGVYGILRSLAVIRSQEELRIFPMPRLIGMNLVVLFFFLATVSISLAPLAEWSKDTNRGVQSGSNQGKGGLERSEAMSWSLPPEELAGFIIPGFFGLSRQEAGANPPNIESYYWGRMVFTQTVSYMGLLPWLLVPLPLIFRRDRYTWLAVLALAGGVVFSMGKYTPVYNFLYDYFPGINRFRVPKMMMFIPVMGLGVLAARGFDLLFSAEIRATDLFRRYMASIIAVPVVLLVLLGLEIAGRNYLTSMFLEVLARPTRYEQGMYLVDQRWGNLVKETAITACFAAVGAALLVAGTKWRRLAGALPFLLVAFYLTDTWRVNNKFMFLVDAPKTTRSTKSPVSDFLAKDSNQFRVLPMDGQDPMLLVSNKVPVMFTSNPVQQRRWQEFLDNFSLNSAMPDLLNVKYVVFNKEQYLQDRAQLSDKFVPVFTSPDGAEMIFENKRVLPKAWLVPAALVTDVTKSLQLLSNPAFNPLNIALVESTPPLPLAAPDFGKTGDEGDVRVTRYEGEHISVATKNDRNALLVLGEKYYKGWRAMVDGKESAVYPVNHVLRGVYLPPGKHAVEFIFDPLPFKVGRYVTLVSFAFFAAMLIRESLWLRKRRSIGQ